eukprot:1468213-Rhodomonas_salina.1
MRRSSNVKPTLPRRETASQATPTTSPEACVPRLAFLSVAVVSWAPGKLQPLTPQEASEGGGRRSAAALKGLSRGGGEEDAAKPSKEAWLSRDRREFPSENSNTDARAARQTRRESPVLASA